MPGRSCQRTCPLCWAPLVLETGGDRCGWAQLQAASVSGGRAGHQVGSLAKASHVTAYRGVGLVLSYTRLVARGRMRVSPAPATNIVASPTSKSTSGRCRGWCAASSANNPPGYAARAWFTYGASSVQWRCCGGRWPTLRPSAAGRLPWIGAGLTAWTGATPWSTRRGLHQSL